MTSRSIEVNFFSFDVFEGWAQQQFIFAFKDPKFLFRLLTIFLANQVFHVFRSKSIRPTDILATDV